MNALTPINQTLADLDTLVVVHADGLPNSTKFAARKAIARIAQAAGNGPEAILAADVLDRHASLDDHPGRDEQAALHRILSLPPLPLPLLQRIRHGEATLADALAVVETAEGLGEERQRILATLTTFAARLLTTRGLTPPCVPGTVKSIDRLLADFTHLDYHLTPKGWSNFRARVRRAVRLVDYGARTRLSVSLLSGPWADLVELARAPEIPQGVSLYLAKIWPLIDYSYRHGIGPTAVDDGTITDLHADLQARSRVDSFAIARDAVYGWEHLQAAVPAWPQTTLGRLYRDHGRRQGFALKFNDLPDALKADWEDFCRRFGKAAAGRPLAAIVEGAARHRTLNTPRKDELAVFADTTLRTMRTAVVELANAADRLHRPFTNLVGLIDPDIAADALFEQRQRQRQMAASAGSPIEDDDDQHTSLAARAQHFASIARYLGCGTDTLDALSELRDSVDPQYLGTKGGKRQYRKEAISSRHKERIRRFCDPVIMKAWLDAPFTLFDVMRAVARSGHKPTLEQIGDAIIAVLYAATLCCPARRRNLATLTIYGTHANVRLPPGGKGVGQLFIHWSQVKNQTNIHAILDPHAITVINLWMTFFRPALMDYVGADADNPYLFPARGSGHRAPEMLNRGFVDRNRKLGYLLNLQCQRHLCAKVVLDQDPTAMELVRQILGHKSIQTTKTYYAEVDALVVHERWQDLLEHRRRSIYGEVPNGF